MPIAPNSAEARDIAYHIHGQTDLKAHEEKGPKIISKGDGVHVYDDDGKEFIEGLAGLWSVSLGFNEPRLVDAATRQLRELPYYHTFAHKTAQNPPFPFSKIHILRLREARLPPGPLGVLLVLQ